MSLQICPLIFISEALYLVATAKQLKHLLWLAWHQLCLLCQAFTMCFVTKAMPICFTNSKCHIKKLKICRTGLTGYYKYLSQELLLMSSGQTDTHIHTYMHTPTSLTKIRQPEYLSCFSCTGGCGSISQQLKLHILQNAKWLNIAGRICRIV